MLPDIRAVVAAILAAVGLIMASFGMVATLRVAQQHQSVSLQADLATRGRSGPPANAGERAIPVVDTPGAAPAPASPAIAVPAAPLEPPVAATAPPAEAPRTTQAMQAAPPAEPPIGGPLAEPPRRQTETPGNTAAENPSGNLERAATAKARKARAARVARERKAAAKRAAQDRRAQQPASPSIGGTNTFGNFNQFGGTFRQ